LESQDFSAVDHNDPSWPSKVIPFSVEQLTDSNMAVSRHFETQIVRYAGSFEGCGCGFNASYAPEWYDPVKEDDHYIAGVESRRLLREYVEQHKIRQIYACWSGDEALDAESYLDITPDQLTDLNFEIPQLTMLRIQES